MGTQKEQKRIQIYYHEEVYTNLNRGVVKLIANIVRSDS